ncbi:hypothetical protein D3C73_1607600 [compost metagenome]
MTLHTNIFNACDSTMVRVISGTSKFGMMLVYKLPGPTRMASAFFSASTASSKG